MLNIFDLISLNSYYEIYKIHVNRAQKHTFPGVETENWPSARPIART